MSKQLLVVHTDWETGLPVRVIEGDITLQEVTRLWGTQELRDRFDIETEDVDTDEHPNWYLR